MVSMSNDPPILESPIVPSLPSKKITFCPVCGAAGFDPAEYIGAKSMVKKYQCGTCGFEFYVNAGTSTMALIHKDDDTVLMIRRARDPAAGTLDLPGGFVDLAEPAEDAVCREILEETNLTVSSFSLFKKTYCNEYLYGGVLYHTLDLVYLCRVEDWSCLRSNDPEEGEPVLVSLSALDLRDVGLTSVRRFLSDYLHQRRDT